MKSKLLTLACLLTLVHSTLAVTRNWTNTVGGNWFGAGNWSPNGVPTSIDVANITNNGSYTVTVLTGAVSVASLNLGGASGAQTLLIGTGNNLNVTNLGTVRANGLLSVTNGGVEGRVTIQSGGQLNLSGSQAKNLYSLVLVNEGTVNWSGGNLQGGFTTTVVSNGGLWQITTDSTFYNYWGNTIVFTNAATLRKNGGSGMAALSGIQMVNRPGALIEVTTGTLSISGQGSNVLGGTLTASAPGLLNLAGGPWLDAGATASGTGTNQFSAGLFNLRTNPIPGLRLYGGEIFITGTNSFQQAGAITNLLLEGSQLRGTNRVGVGALTINSGGVDGQLTVTAAGQLNLPTTLAKNLYSLVLINQGTVNWSGGVLQGGYTTTIVSNGGLWQITTDNNFYNYWGNSILFTNAGTVRKSAGSTTTAFNGMKFVNLPAGQVETLAGTFSFGGAVTSVLGGTFTATAPGQTTLASGDWVDAGGSATGSGTNRFSGGTLTLRTNIIPGLMLGGGDVYVAGNSFQQAGAITNLTLEGSQLRGTNRIGAGTLSINAGGVDGQLTISPTGQLILPGSLPKNLYSLFLVNQGTVAWSGGVLQAGYSPTTVVSNGGLWQLTTDSSFYNYWGSTVLFTNAGILRKNGGGGTASLSGLEMVNRPGGLIDVTSGMLTINGAGTNVLSGALTATAPGVFNIVGGIWTDAGATASGSGTNQFTGGTFNLRTNPVSGLRLMGGDVFVIGTNSFQQAGAVTNLVLEGSQLRGTNRVAAGNLTITAGGVEGLLTILPPGQLNFSNAAAKNVYSLTLLNQGVVNWAGGNLLGGYTSTLVSNGGLWQITADATFYNYWGNTVQFTNAGTLRKSGGAGLAALSGMGFIDLAGSVVQADVGTLQLPLPVTNSVGTLRLNGGTIQGAGTYGMIGGTLDGSGVFGANAITGGTVSPGQSGPGLLRFPSGLNLGAGATVSLAGTGITPGTQHDQLSVTGAVSLANATLQIPALPSVAAGTAFTLILNDGVDAISGTFNGLPENALVPVGAQPFRIHYAGGTGNDVTLVRDAGVIVLGPSLSGGGYTGGTFQLRGSGSNGVVYTVQATTNFLQWTNLGLATGNLSGSFLFNDSNAFRYPHRFYRTTN